MSGLSGLGKQVGPIDQGDVVIILMIGVGFGLILGLLVPDPWLLLVVGAYGIAWGPICLLFGNVDED